VARRPAIERYLFARLLHELLHEIPTRETRIAGALGVGSEQRTSRVSQFVGMLRRNSEQLASVPDALRQLSVKTSDRLLHLAQRGAAPVLKLASLQSDSSDGRPWHRIMSPPQRHVVPLARPSSCKCLGPRTGDQTRLLDPEQ